MQSTPGARVLLYLVIFVILAFLPYVLAIAKHGWFVQFLLILNIVTFCFMLALSVLDYAGLDSLYLDTVFDTSLALDPLSWHRAFWSMAIHAGPMHLIGNMLVLFFIGVPLEERVGTWRTMAIYVAAGFMGALAFALFHLGEQALVVGASGAIFGLMGALLVLYPKDKIAMFVGPIFMSRVPVYIAVGAAIAIETVFVAVSVRDGTAHIAHVGGFAAGAILAPILMQIGRTGRKKTEISYSSLERLATTPELRELLEKVKNEDIKDVRDAWLGRFLELAECAKCGGAVRKSGNGGACQACGKKY
ncbi:MAG: rhomboid family intramembrane serine protease [Euryarchaeota archaeon]|nr:rhomboid family intramembrane serine protease [Euryarchaeota archaeon]